MAKPFVPEDPFLLAPSEQQLQDWINRNVGRKPEALKRWEEDYKFYQAQAERRGFSNPFHMVARDTAEAERDEQTRQREARNQAEFAREIGGDRQQPQSAPAQQARQTIDNPAARPEDATATPTARPKAPIGYTRMPPQPTILGSPPRATAEPRQTPVPARPASGARGDEVGNGQGDRQDNSRRDDKADAGRDLRYAAAADGKNTGSDEGSEADKDGTDAARNTIKASDSNDTRDDDTRDDDTLDGSSAGDADGGRPKSADSGHGRWAGPYSEAQRQGANWLYGALSAGRIASRQEAERHIKRFSAGNPDLARQFEQALTAVFDADGRPRRLLPGSSDNLGAVRALALKVKKNELDDVHAELERKAFANLEKSGRYRINPSDDPDMLFISRSDGKGGRIPLARALAFAIGEAGERADAGLAALHGLSDGDPEDALRRLETLLPRAASWSQHGKQALRTVHAWADPEALNQVKAGIELIRRGVDPSKVAAALAPLVLHEALEPSWARIAVETLVMLSPIGTAIDAWDSTQHLFKAIKEGNPADILLATGGVLLMALSAVPAGKLLSAGRQVRRFSRQITGLDNAKAIEILKNSESSTEKVAAHFKEVITERYLRDGKVRLTIGEAIEKYVPDDVQKNMTQAERSKFAANLKYLLSRAPEIEVENFLVRHTADTLWMRDKDFYERIKDKLKEQKGGQYDNIMRQKILTAKDLRPYGKDIVRAAEEKGVLAIEIKSGGGKPGKAQLEDTQRAKDRGIPHAIQTFTIPHHEYTDETIAAVALEIMDRHNALVAIGNETNGHLLATGVGFEHLVEFLKAVRGHVPPKYSGLNLALFAIGGVVALYGGGRVVSNNGDDKAEP